MRKLAANDDHDMFTMGGCHILAMAIHDLTGWQLCALEDYDGYSHAFVRTPRETYLDIEGEHVDLNGFLDRWHADEIRDAGPEDFDDWQDDFDVAEVIERAAELAPDLVLAFLGGQVLQCLR